MQYLRDNAGVLESSANGTTWTPVILKGANPLSLGTLLLRDNSGAFEVSYDAGATWLPITQGAMPLIGEIRMLSHETIPAGWLLCGGQTILRTSALGVLYATLGYPYGAGDGTTTCNIPDLVWRFPFGASAIDEVGLEGGVEGAIMPNDALANAPHTHDIAIDYASAAGTANTFVRGGTSEGTLTFTSSATGGEKMHENLPPYLTLNFIIYVGV